MRERKRKKDKAVKVTSENRNIRGKVLDILITTCMNTMTLTSYSNNNLQNLWFSRLIPVQYFLCELHKIFKEL